MLHKIFTKEEFEQFIKNISDDDLNKIFKYCNLEEIEGEKPMNKEQKIQELTERIEKSQAEIDELKEELRKLQKKPYEVEVPEDVNRYYALKSNGDILRGFDYCFDDTKKAIYRRGLMFETDEEVRQYDRERILLFKLHKWAKEQQGDWKPDWNNIDQCKYYVEPNRLVKKTIWDGCWVEDKLPKLPYFKSEEIAQACIDEFGDEILEVFC